MIPAAFAYQRPASIDEALSHHRFGSGREGPGRRPEPPAAPQAPSRCGRHARRHRPAARAQGRPPARRRPARGRRADDLRRAARVAGQGLRPAPRRIAAHRRRPGPQPGNGRRGDRPLPIPASDLPACLLALDAELVIRSARANGRPASTASSRAVHDRPPAGRAPDRDPAAGSARRCRLRLRLPPAAGVRLRHGRCRGGRSADGERRHRDGRSR